MTKQRGWPETSGCLRDLVGGVCVCVCVCVLMDGWVDGGNECGCGGVWGVEMSVEG